MPSLQASLQPKKVDTPLLEPFLRGLLLGVGAVWMLETSHVTLQVRTSRGRRRGASVAAAAGRAGVAAGRRRPPACPHHPPLPPHPAAAPQFCGLLGPSAFTGSQLGALLPRVEPPLFVADHVAALAAGVACYMLEAAAVGALLRHRQEHSGTVSCAKGVAPGHAGRPLAPWPRRPSPAPCAHPHPLQAAEPALIRIAALTKKLVPLPLHMFRTLSAQRTTAATAAAGPVGGAPTAERTPATTAPASATMAAFAQSDSATAGQTLAQAAGQLTLPLPQQRARCAGGGSNIVPAPPGVEEGLAGRRSRKGLAPGELDESASPYARRQKELAGRRSYLKK